MYVSTIDNLLCTYLKCRPEQSWEDTYNNRHNTCTYSVYIGRYVFYTNYGYRKYYTNGLNELNIQKYVRKQLYPTHTYHG